MDLYYIPVIVGALAFGLRGAIVTYIFVVSLYFPYIFFVWRAKTLFLAEDCLHTLFFGVFAFFAGFLVDREKRYRKQLEKDAYLAALGRTAASVTHDLRNSLTVVTGFARRMLEKKGNTDAAIEAILNAAHTMHKIVDSTLDFAKPLQLTLQEVDIITVINHALDTCKTKAERHEVNVSLNLPSEPLLFAIDGFLFERALINLIDNAIEASEIGRTVTITVNPGKTYMTISIKDHGSGMDRETLKNIFMPFYTTKPNGTGIGMAITKKVIDHHQGTIRIDSKPGQGTAINIELPYHPVHK
jgi:signal transduction histidine kinase